MAKKKVKEEVVSQGIYVSDADNLKIIGQMHDDGSIAETIKRMFRVQIRNALKEAMDRKQAEWKQD